MASPHQNYYWQSGDTVWRVAAQFLLQSRYPDVATFVEAVRQRNPTVLDWQAVPAAGANSQGTLILIPLLS